MKAVEAVPAWCGVTLYISAELTFTYEPEQRSVKNEAQYYEGHGGGFISLCQLAVNGMIITMCLVIARDALSAGRHWAAGLVTKGIFCNAAH